MMSKEKKSPLLIATFASLLSFVSLLITLSLPQELSQPQVLGVIAPPRTSNNLVPCSVIESWQKQYCSTTNISPVPTKYITPTPVAGCNPSATLISTNITCKSDSKLISYATYRCQNGSFIRVGDSTGIKCYDHNTLYWQALNKCFAYCTPNTPTPTIAKITPTRAPTPTLAPTIKTSVLIPTSLNPNASGTLSYYRVPVATNYSDFKFSSININGLLPNTLYQLHICVASTNCNSSEEVKITSDSSGAIRINNTLVIGSVNTNYQSFEFRLYQPLSAGPLPTPSPNTCYMLTVNSQPCLNASFSL